MILQIQGTKIRLFINFLNILVKNPSQGVPLRFATGRHLPGFASLRASHPFGPSRRLTQLSEHDFQDFRIGRIFFLSGRWASPIANILRPFRACQKLKSRLIFFGQGGFWFSYRVFIIRLTSYRGRLSLFQAKPQNLNYNIGNNHNHQKQL